MIYFNLAVDILACLFWLGLFVGIVRRHGWRPL